MTDILEFSLACLATQKVARHAYNGALTVCPRYFLGGAQVAT